MKRAVAIMIAVLCIITVMAGCNAKGGKDADANVAKSAKVKSFERSLEDDDYEEAIEKYEKNISGNAKLEAEAADVIEAYVKSISSGVLSGDIDEKEAKVKLSTAESVYNETKCPVSNFSAAKNDVQNSLNSKVAYKSGISLYESGNYGDAVTEFLKVLPEDADYVDAMAKIELAKDSYKTELFNETDSLLTENDYKKAISKLQKATELFKDDSDILAKLNTCKKNHVAYIIESAEAAFVDYTHYEEALSIIQGGIQHYSGESRLAELKEYYSSFAPVSVYDMDPLKGEAATETNDTDIYGNEYDKSFWSGYGSWSIYSGDTDITYYIENKYNIFTATLYGRATKNDYSVHSVQIYGDGKRLYQNTKVRSDKKAFDISVDITGVEELRIVIDRDGGGITTGIGMSNMFIQKTEV